MGFLITSSGNNVTSCRTVCSRVTTLEEQSEAFGSSFSQFQLSNTSTGTTKHKMTLVTRAGKLVKHLEEGLADRVSLADCDLPEVCLPCV